MNSPPDPASPSPSTPSSGSPPPEETNYQPYNATSHLLNFASQVSSAFSGSPSKRRLPGGSSFGAASSNRDPKSRRREDSRRLGGGGNWESGKESGKREKEDLVDNNVVEYLRKGQ